MESTKPLPKDGLGLEAVSITGFGPEERMLCPRQVCRAVSVAYGGREAGEEALAYGRVPAGVGGREAGEGVLALEASVLRVGRAGSEV